MSPPRRRRHILIIKRARAPRRLPRLLSTVSRHRQTSRTSVIMRRWSHWCRSARCHIQATKQTAARLRRRHSSRRSAAVASILGLLRGLRLGLIPSSSIVDTWGGWRGSHRHAAEHVHASTGGSSSAHRAVVLSTGAAVGRRGRVPTRCRASSRHGIAGAGRTLTAVRLGHWGRQVEEASAGRGLVGRAVLASLALMARGPLLPSSLFLKKRPNMLRLR